ncbi:ABC transporter permease [Herbidospora galbida]|uniref:ABC transporter permease n=1 Tax=Herbidospora galbida TaxID=2575442 RepID=A0A4U3M6R2_9ACTN|nr:ABC transporter permease [Herbidospora galbida]TKK83962.1 ABC transporter permease [Herbidospora galbida]
MSGTSRHIRALAGCIVAALAGLLLIGTGLHLSGAGWHIARCLSGDESPFDAAVLPAGYPGLGTIPSLPETAVPQIRAVPGVADAVPVQGGEVGLVGFGTLVPLEAVALDMALLSSSGMEGEAPRSASDAILDKRTADQLHLQIGETITVHGNGADRSFEITGMTAARGNPTFDVRGTLGVLPMSAADLVGPLETEAVHVRADNDVDPGELRDRLQASLGGEYDVVTHAEMLATGDVTAETLPPVLGVVGSLLVVGAALTAYMGRQTTTTTSLLMATAVLSVTATAAVIVASAGLEISTPTILAVAGTTAVAAMAAMVLRPKILAQIG